MSGFTRRKFLVTSSMAGVGAIAATAIPYRSTSAQTFEAMIPQLGDRELRTLVTAAIDAAKTSGAVYADVQIRTVRWEVWSFVELGYSNPSLSAKTGIGVRALVNGYWGFAGMDGIGTTDDVVRLGRDASAQARIASKGKPRTAELAQTPPVANGTWIMPVEIDPFTVSFEEKAEFFTGMRDHIQRIRYGIETGADGISFQKEERTFASTEGSFINQTVYKTGGSLNVAVPSYWVTEIDGSRSADFLSPSGAGREYIRKAPLQDKAPQLIDEAFTTRTPKPIDVGRYDIVFDAHAIAGIISTTIGAATELDRAMGYEANNAGTSYINEPLEMLGTFKIGSPLLNITANRSMSGGASTVKWDDEGVEPVETKLVKDGILNDYQTTRESASWIASHYQNNGVPIRSNGCAGIYTPATPVTQVNPNLVMKPGAEEVSFIDMIKDTKKGLAIVGGSTNADHQVLNGTGSGSIVYEIVDGKIGRAMAGAQYLYRAPDFWKNLVTIGGKSTVHTRGFDRSRNGGEMAHTVSAVPVKVTSVAVTDVKRKA